MNGKFFLAGWAILFCGVLTEHALAAPKYAHYPLKFGLVCRGFDKIVYKPYPPEAGLGLSYQEGSLALHYWVDLDAMEYCTDRVCSDGHQHKIDLMRGDRLVFQDDRRFETVNLATLQYDRVVQEVEGVVWAMKTKCRMSPFSGIR